MIFIIENEEHAVLRMTIQEKLAIKAAVHFMAGYIKLKDNKSDEDVDLLERLDTIFDEL